MTSFSYNGEIYAIMRDGTIYRTNNFVICEKLAHEGVATSQVNQLIIDGLYREIELDKNIKYITIDGKPIA